jgi:hypothetical protein
METRHSLLQLGWVDAVLEGNLTEEQLVSHRFVVRAVSASHACRQNRLLRINEIMRSRSTTERKMSETWGIRDIQSSEA